MSKLAIRKEDRGHIFRDEWLSEPFKRMRELFRFEPWLRWDPFAEILPLRASDVGVPTFIPDFDVKETKDAFIFKADLPGVKEQDLGITLTGDRLTVSGKRENEREEKGETYYTYERSFGSFARSFSLPHGVNADQARAELKEGILTLVVPKPPGLQSKHIPVKAIEKAKA